MVSGQKALPDLAPSHGGSKSHLPTSGKCFTASSKTAGPQLKGAKPPPPRPTLWGVSPPPALANQDGQFFEDERGIRPDFERCGTLTVQMTDSHFPNKAVDSFLITFLLNVCLFRFTPSPCDLHAPRRVDVESFPMEPCAVSNRHTTVRRKSHPGSWRRESRGSLHCQLGN
jgi:hypothetical protein